MPNKKRDHGGGLDAAIAQYGGDKSDWIDLSTGINPVPYPIGAITQKDWSVLPDQNARTALLDAARIFWQIPPSAAILSSPGLSALIARLPSALDGQSVTIPGPTYNEYAAAFSDAGWTIKSDAGDITVLVHPNNPDGRLWDTFRIPNSLTIVDESFCDTEPATSYINQTVNPNCLVLKSFGKFWGLAGVRLGFAIGPIEIIDRLATALGPWPVSGPALAIGTRALSDPGWASQTRARLAKDAKRLDDLFRVKGARIVGGTTLFRLYHVDDAVQWQAHLAKHQIWSRIFPYSENWLRLGIPGPADWEQLEQAL